MTEEVPMEHAPTAPANFSVCLRGFTDAATAEQFGRLIAEVIQGISAGMDLERLDGVTIAFDYAAALAELDRGFAQPTVLTPTATSGLVGVAMAPTVIRDGVYKGHLVFDARLILAIDGEELTPQLRHALYLIAHECGHVADLKQRDLAFPGTALHWPAENWETDVLHQFACGAWDEYAACRMSAPYYPEIAEIYADNLTAVLSSSREQAIEHLIAYQAHKDAYQLMATAGTILTAPLRQLAYLLGHLDGIGKDLGYVPAVRTYIEDNGCNDMASFVHEELAAMWDSRGEWQPMIFQTLMNVARTLLMEGGILMRGNMVKVLC